MASENKKRKAKNSYMFNGGEKQMEMALLDIQMVRFEEIFLPYIETQNGQTIFERLEDKQFFLETVN